MNSHNSTQRTLGTWQVFVDGVAIVVAASTLVSDFFGFFTLGGNIVVALGTPVTAFYHHIRYIPDTRAHQRGSDRLDLLSRILLDHPLPGLPRTLHCTNQKRNQRGYYDTRSKWLMASAACGILLTLLGLYYAFEDAHAQYRGRAAMIFAICLAITLFSNPSLYLDQNTPP